MTTKIFRFYFFQLLLSLLIFSQSVFSQPEFKRSYALGLTNLSLLDLSFIFTQQLHERTYLEVTNSFVYHKNDEYDTGETLLLTIKDPYELYDLYRFRLGLRYYSEKNFYVSPMVIFNVGGFNDCLIKRYIDDKGSDAYDKNYRLSRTKLEFGTILKFGYLKYYNNHFLVDTYFGIGFKVKCFFDSITEIRPWPYSGIADYDYPIEEQHLGFMPTIHFGVLIGYAK
jgi:hypothetical protein